MTTTMNTSKPSLGKRKIQLLKERSLRNKYIADQIKIGLRNQLRALRDERGLTQGELAELIGTKQSVISRIEKNPLRVGMPIFLAIANHLDVAFVARFEAIDTFARWYENLNQMKMIPRKSTEILNELENAQDVSDVSAARVKVRKESFWSVVQRRALRKLLCETTPIWTASDEPDPLVIELVNVDIIDEPKAIDLYPETNPNIQSGVLHQGSTHN